MSNRKALQNLRQDKIVQVAKYEAARKIADELGMRRARLEIEKINKEIIKLTRGK